MTPWWSPDATSRVVPPLCIVCAVAGAALGKYASLGRRRAIVVGGWIGIIVVYGAVGIAGFVGLTTGQPEYLWKPLVFAGFFTAVPYAALYHVMKNRYTEFELRKARARDL